MDRYEAIEKRIEEGDVIVDFIVNGKEYKAKVVGFNLSIGATFINTDDPNDYLLCTYGPLSPLLKGQPAHKKHNIYMSLLLYGIENGLINWDIIEEEMCFETLLFSVDASSETCSFNQ